MSDLNDRLVAQAMLDVSIERLTHFHPGVQLFVFGAHGDPMWTPWPPTAHDLEIFRAAVRLLEQHEARPAPLSVKGMSGLYTAMVLDAERTLMAVVIHKPRAKKPVEDRGVPEISGRSSTRDVSGVSAADEGVATVVQLGVAKR